MYSDRVACYKELEELRRSKLLVYITGDRPGMETQIQHEVLDYFSEHLDTFASPKKISLYLYSTGGDILAGWSIVNLIRQYCDEFEVIVPSKARSTATLITLGADRIIMTKKATLGPIDPSVTIPLNPQTSGSPERVRFPISVEAVAGYLELATAELNIKNEQLLTSILLKLSDLVHPLALGQIYRTRLQIQALAAKLLKTHLDDENKIEKIISFLSSKSGSHDYTIHSKQAASELHLPIEEPDEELDRIIKKIYDDFREELELNSRYNQNIFIGENNKKEYSFNRAAIESISGGYHKFISQGVLEKSELPTKAELVKNINDKRIFEGWKHE
jgi:hypothetical protein